MSLFVPLAQGVQAEFRYHLDNRILTNRLWFVVVAGDPTAADLTAIGDGLKTWWIARLQPLLSQDIELTSIRCYDATIPYPGTHSITLVVMNGGRAEGSYSANVAIKLSFQTEQPPGHWLNWNFIGGIPLSAVTLNTIDPAYASALEDAFDFLLDVFSLFVYRWEATKAVEDNVPLSTRDHHRIDHIKARSPFVSQRRTRLTNPL